MSDFELKLCRNCKYSSPESTSTWDLECLHPKVNVSNAWFLGTANPGGKSTRQERESNWNIIWRTPCGTRGALFELKKENNHV